MLLLDKRVHDVESMQIAIWVVSTDAADAQDHHFFIGQTLNQFRSGSPNEPFVSWVHKWPSAPFVRFFTFGNAEALLVTSLGAYRELSQSQCYSFEKPGFLVRLLDDIIGKGLFFAQAEDHKKQRKFLNGNPAASSSQMDACVMKLTESARPLLHVQPQNIPPYVPLQGPRHSRDLRQGHRDRRWSRRRYAPADCSRSQCCKN